MTTSTVDSFRILVVCTGNICRSPLAERLLTAEFTRRGVSEHVVVSSAGTAALVGQPMDDRAIAHTIGHGGNPSGHIAVQLTPELVDPMDLVLTMERSHRADVVRLVPRANRIAFTIREFARLLNELRASGEAAEPDPGSPISERLRRLVPDVAAGRGMTPPSESHHDEIADPYKRSDDVYTRSVQQIAAAATTIADVMTELTRTDGRA